MKKQTNTTPFEVYADDETKTLGYKLLAHFQRTEDSQGAALKRLFNYVEDHLLSDGMKTKCVDMDAVESSFSCIRNVFSTVLEGKDQIVSEKDRKLAEVKNLKDEMEADLRKKLSLASTEKENALAQAKAAANATAQALKEAQAAKEQAETKSSLVAEKDRTISTLADKLANAEAKIAGYDALTKKAADAQEQIKDLQRTIETIKKSHEVEIRELNVRLERQLSDAEKDSALAVATAVSDKEKELTTLLHESEKEIARLQARFEVIEERNKF